uniref:Uncharacterized protein n=1 Tax=Lepeophtheirus salmonis TaxID=72036 RepID=A0A0K2UKN8_LEPSM
MLRTGKILWAKIMHAIHFAIYPDCRWVVQTCTRWRKMELYQRIRCPKYLEPSWNPRKERQLGYGRDQDKALDRDGCQWTGLSFLPHLQKKVSICSRTSSRFTFGLQIRWM